VIRATLAEQLLRDGMADARHLTDPARAMLVRDDVRGLAAHLVAERDRLLAEPPSHQRDAALAAIDGLGSLGVVALQASELPIAPPEVFLVLADAVTANARRLITALDAARAAGA
jgi:hypothetical protein